MYCAIRAIIAILSVLFCACVRTFIGFVHQLCQRPRGNPFEDVHEVIARLKSSKQSHDEWVVVQLCQDSYLGQYARLLLQCYCHRLGHYLQYIVFCRARFPLRIVKPFLIGLEKEQPTAGQECEQFNSQNRQPSSTSTSTST